MKLHAALKKKNQIVNKMNTVKARMLHNNSYLEGAKPTYDSRELYQEYLSLQQQLIELKTAIELCNAPILMDILHLGELKSMAQNLKSMDVKSGPVSSYKSEEPIMYQCNITELERDKMVEQIEETIQKIQDHIDHFNATTEVVFDDGTPS